MKSVCKQCGAAIPDGHAACPLCGKAAPPLDIPLHQGEVINFAHESKIIREGLLRTRAPVRALEGAMMALAVPVILPGFLLTLLFAKRWGRVPLSLVIVEGVLMTGLSYLSFERGDHPLGGLVFPLLLASCGAVAVLSVMRAVKGRSGESGLLGYSALVTFLMIGGGGLLYGSAGAILHRLRAPRFVKMVSDVPRPLSVADALAHKDLLVHADLAGARLDTANAAWRTSGAGADAFFDANAETEDVLRLEASELFARKKELLGRRVSLNAPTPSGSGKRIPEDWRDFIRSAAPRGASRYWVPVGGDVLERVYQVSELIEPDDRRGVKELLVLEIPIGILAEVPQELLESTNGLDQRGPQPGIAKALAILSAPAPRSYCAPVEGTNGALWIQFEGPTPSSTLRGVLEWPEEGSLAALAKRAFDVDVRPRVLVVGSATEYRNTHGLVTEAAEGIPLHHWGYLVLGALLTAVAILLGVRE